MIDYKKKNLPNGMKFVTSKNEHTEAVTILILVKIGGRYEDPKVAGISHFLEHMFFKGTKKRPSAYKLAKELDCLGASYNAFTSEEYTGFYIQSDAEDFEKSIEILSDLFLNPIFPESEFEREKGVILEELNMRKDVPQVHVQVLAQEQMFKGNALARDLVGTRESIASITRNDVINYFKKGYSPEATTLVIAGNPKDSDWEKTASKYFKMNKRTPEFDYERFEGTTVDDKFAQEVRAVDQAHLVLSAITSAKTDKSRYALSILSTILGGSMSSRLFTEIREKRGWAYYVKSDLAAFADTGLISFSAGVKKDKLGESVKLILDEMKNIAKDGPTEEEMDRAKRNLRGHLAIGLENSFEVATYLAEDIFYEDKVRQPEEIIKSWNKVTAREVQEVATKVFASDRIGLSVIGPNDYKVEADALANYYQEK